MDPYTNPDAALRLMRFVSLLLSLGVVALAWLAGKLLSDSKDQNSIQNPKSKIPNYLPVLLPLTVALLPMHAFSSGMANNDVLADLAVSALVVAIIALLRWPHGWRGVLLAVSVIAIALISSGTKSSALTAVVPLTVLGLAAWGWKWRVASVEWRETTTRTLPLHTRRILVFAGVALLVATPLLFHPLGTAAGWRLNNRPMDKVPVAYSPRIGRAHV